MATSDAMVCIYINDLFDELITENTRLTNELMFVHKYLKLFNDMQKHLTSIYSKYETLIAREDIKVWKTLEQLVDNKTIDNIDEKQSLIHNMTIDNQESTRNSCTDLVDCRSQYNDQLVDELSSMDSPTTDKSSTKQLPKTTSHRIKKSMITTRKSTKRFDKILSDDRCDKSDDQSNGNHNYKSQLKTKKNKCYLCPIGDCGRQFTAEGRLKKHLVISHYNPKLYVCRYSGCGKTFNKKFSYDRHTIIHTENRQTYQCSECNKSYTTERVLVIHKMAMHSMIKTFKCGFDGCDQWFFKPNQRIFHRKTVHNIIYRQTYRSCQWPGCDYQTNRKGEYVAHQRIHTGELPFECQWPDCGKRFRRKLDYQKHRDCHLNSKRWINT
ncbi:zinc finger protein 813-like [Oppia nitens]|uniref:zinc finger protein 813-like n=1 Tax=Oppia nitens TaxID=1686743 RepID=UPI0023DA30FB|nr:zinc finger protein 813-like [Oppia nitens]